MVSPTMVDGTSSYMPFTSLNRFVGLLPGGRVSLTLIVAPNGRLAAKLTPPTGATSPGGSSGRLEATSVVSVLIRVPGELSTSTVPCSVVVVAANLPSQLPESEGLAMVGPLHVPFSSAPLELMESVPVVVTLSPKL